ncbi:hypothetical protein SALBM135S_04247 [Streptomyces alboniger]
MPNQWPTISWPLSDETLTADCTSFLFVMPLSKLIDTGMPTPTVEPSSGVKFPMKLLACDTVVNVEFSCALRPSESVAVAVISYFVARSSCLAGFQDLLSADIRPATAVPSAVSMDTSVSVPLLTVTAAALLMLALSEPFFGAILIWATDVFLAAASSTWFCDSLPPEALPPSSLHAESTSTPPTRADTAARPLRPRPGVRRLLSVITNISIVAESRTNPRVPVDPHNVLPGSSRSTTARNVGNTTFPVLDRSSRTTVTTVHRETADGSTAHCARRTTGGTTEPRTTVAVRGPRFRISQSGFRPWIGRRRRGPGAGRPSAAQTSSSSSASASSSSCSQSGASGS